MRRWSEPREGTFGSGWTHVLACAHPAVGHGGWPMASRRSRESAYADLVAGLLDVRTDPATDRFDAELAAAEEDGRVDPQTAKVLRWWQREALRALVDHARTVVPPTMLAIE